MAEHASAPENRNWRVSRTCDGGACVMVARDGEFVLFGNTSKPDGPAVTFTRAEWQDFLVGVKSGDFDDLF